MNFEPRETLQAIEAERVSAFLGITTMLNYMMAVDDFDSHDLSSLRLIKYGGGPMAGKRRGGDHGALPVRPDAGLR